MSKEGNLDGDAITSILKTYTKWNNHQCAYSWWKCHHNNSSIKINVHLQYKFFDLTNPLFTWSKTWTFTILFVVNDDGKTLPVMKSTKILKKFDAKRNKWKNSKKTHHLIKIGYERLAIEKLEIWRAPETRH